MVFAVPLWLVHFIAIIALIFASITDLKKREVPDIINYSLIVIGLILGLLSSIFNISPWPFISSVAGLLFGYLIGSVMFYTGQWGGGDAKMLIGLGALLGFDIYALIENGISTFFSSPFVNVFIAIVLTGIIYGIGFLLFLGLKYRRSFRKYFKKYLSKKPIHRTRLIVTSLVFLGVVSSLIFQRTDLKLTIIIFSGLIYVLYYFLLAVRIIEQEILLVPMPVEELTPGEWVAKDLFFTIPEQSPVKSIKQKVSLYYVRGEDHTTKKRTSFINKRTKEVITRIAYKIYSKKHFFTNWLWFIASRSNPKKYGELHKKIIFALHLETKEKFDSYIKKNSRRDFR
jgi:Flp pilus assembly protein protease CpaA